MADTVTVRCFIPHGLVIYTGPGPFGADQVILAGPPQDDPSIAHGGHLVIGGFTDNTVDADLWASWFAANASGPLVMNGGVVLVS
jgi:hypothetical protein